MKNEANIDWQYTGKNDYVNGTGAYIEEKILGYLGSIIIPILLLYKYFTGQTQWTNFQLIIALILGFDLGGGMISNSLNSCKRFYHSHVKVSEKKIGHFMKHELLFAIVHFHPFIIGILFHNFDYKYGLYWYLLLNLAVLVVFKTPLYLKRPISMLMILIAIIMNCYFITPITEFEWAMPVLFLKIVFGHSVREEPYRKNL